MSLLFSFFDPDGESSRWIGSKGRKALGQIPIRRLIPNLITLLSLCAGLTAIRMSLEERYDLAIACIIIAAIFDAIDGRIARMLKSTSRFGADLDSLVDLVNFGVAPIVLLYNWSIKDLGSIGWIGMMCFSIAAALRLARFNTALGIQQPKWWANYFIGMPAPAAAIIVLLPLYINSLNLISVQNFPLITLIYVLIISFMMVSKIPTYSSKMIGSRISRDVVVPIFFAILVYMTLLLSYPWKVLIISTIAYWISIWIGILHFQKSKARFGGYSEDDASSLFPLIATNCEKNREEPPID